MKKLLALLLAFSLLLSGCSGPEEEDEDGKLHILATTYPVYLFTTALVEGYDQVEVALMLTQPTSCLHDYNLTVNDMKAIESADVIVMSGAGLEDFMGDALAQTQAPVIDCSADIDLLLSQDHEGHDGHDHDEEYDPHYWLDPSRAALMAQNIAAGLGDLVPGGSHWLEANRSQIDSLLSDLPDKLGDLSALSCRELITFHDGFRYLADYLGLHILKSIEEEEGSEASAREIVEITNLIRAHAIPAIFTEVNGSEATAKAVQRETGVELHQLSMMMSGEGSGLQAYLDVLYANISTILEALS